MIEVENLVKKYPGHTALQGVSFVARKGEIVGYLGPNGSGKTTTLRIVTGYMPATSGSVWVCGYDVLTQSRKARAHIGYLPERVPLYDEMRVHEYLFFRAAIRGIPWRKRKPAVMVAVDKCWLGDVYSKPIGTLSKGYRQRVGLADSIMAEPEVLILDEPTVGLDPLQLKQIRHIIKEYGRDRTVLLSTHILQEVEEMCDRVVLLNKGRIVDTGTPFELCAKYRRKEVFNVTAYGNARQVEKVLREAPAVTGVRKLTKDGDEAELHHFRVEGELNVDLSTKLMSACLANQVRIHEIQRARISLEDVFVGVVYTQFEQAEKEEYAASVDLQDLQTLSPDEIRRFSQQHAAPEQTAAAQGAKEPS